MVFTSNVSPISHTHSTDVVLGSCHFSSASSTVLVLIRVVVTRDWVRVVTVEIVAGKRILREGPHREGMRNE